jgi:hypothetical protein
MQRPIDGPGITGAVSAAAEKDGGGRGRGGQLSRFIDLLADEGL